MIRNILFLNLIILMLSCNLKNNKNSEEVRVIYDIIFADGFDSDQVVFKVNGDMVLEKAITSDKSVGLTSLWYQLIKNGNTTTLIDKNLNKKELEIKDSRLLELSIFFDSQWYSFKPKKELGRYILIDAGETILFEQTQRKPIFD